jgi:glycosyltransferase involved in cell wall biosynthesis
MVKILVTFTYGYSLKTWQESGTLDREISIYLQLQKKFGHEYVFLTYGNESDKKFDLKGLRVEILPIYSYINYSKYKSVNLMRSLLFPFFNKKMFQDIELIKQNQLLGSWISIILKLLLKIPLYTRTGYDMYKFSCEDSKGRIIKYLYLKLTKITVRFSDYYSVSNISDFNYSIRNYPVKNKLLLRPNWVLPVEIIDFNKRSSSRVLCVGRLEYQKNFSYLIRELSDFNIEIDIVGRGQDLDKLKKIAKKSNIKVNFLGNMSNQNLLKLYSKYQIFISTSLFEGHPKTVLEAMSVGCVVILSKISNHEELVNDQENGFLFELREKSLTKAFSKIIKSTKLEVISSNAIKTTKENFSLNKVVEQEHLDYQRVRKL